MSGSAKDLTFFPGPFAFRESAGRGRPCPEGLRENVFLEGTKLGFGKCQCDFLSRFC